MWGDVTACYWNSAADGTQAVYGEGELESNTSGAAPYGGGYGPFPSVQTAHAEWGPGDAPKWDGISTPLPVGGWWKQETLTGGRLPELWWE
jgi:hypothetical protein